MKHYQRTNVKFKERLSLSVSSRRDVQTTDQTGKADRSAQRACAGTGKPATARERCPSAVV